MTYMRCREIAIVAGVVLLATLFEACCDCYQDATEASLRGAYWARRSDGSDSLFLLGEDIFVRKFYPYHGAPVIDTGNWTFHRDRIIFNAFKARDSAERVQSLDGEPYTVNTNIVSKCGGGFAIAFGDDDYYYYWLSVGADTTGGIFVGS